MLWNRKVEFKCIKENGCEILIRRHRHINLPAGPGKNCGPRIVTYHRGPSATVLAGRWKRIHSVQSQSSIFGTVFRCGVGSWFSVIDRAAKSREARQWGEAPKRSLENTLDHQTSIPFPHFPHKREFHACRSHLFDYFCQLFSVSQRCRHSVSLFAFRLSLPPRHIRPLGVSWFCLLRERHRGQSVI